MNGISAHDLLADKIEVEIRELFAQIEQDFGMYNYALLHRPNISDYWVIVLFFDDKEKLNDALESGLCYYIQKVLQGRLELIDKELLWVIQFDVGPYPSDNEAFEHLHKKHITKYDTAKNEKWQDQNCSQCGHDLNKHQLRGHKKEKPYPEEGWIICPEENCFCFSTWSMGQMRETPTENTKI